MEADHQEFLEIKGISETIFIKSQIVENSIEFLIYRAFICLIDLVRVVGEKIISTHIGNLKLTLLIIQK